MPIASDLILASSSPFRRELLAATGLTFKSLTADVDESNISPSDPKVCAIERSLAKAHDVAAKNPGCVVIGGDQVLDFDGHLMGKVSDQAQARDRLTLLSGQTHTLWSGLCLVYKASFEAAPVVLYSDALEIPMEMRKLSSDEIEAYLEYEDQWQGVVGCYKYEELGGQLFLSAGGDQSSIIGLPILTLMSELRTIGINPLLQSKGPWSLALD